MLPRSSLHLRNLLSRHPFRRSSKPISPFPLTPLSNPPNHHFPPSNPVKPHHFHSPTGTNSLAQFKIFSNCRNYSAETDREVDTINLKFAEAREEIESAMESKETVYFDEEAECARGAVGEVLEMYDGLLKKLPEKEKSAIQRSMGLKIEQLKAELEQLDD